MSNGHTNDQEYFELETIPFHDYFRYYNKYRKKYGNKTVVIMEVEDYYEIYDIHANLTNVKYFSQLLNLLLIAENSYFVSEDKYQFKECNQLVKCGFLVVTCDPYISELRKHGYTVICVDCLQIHPQPIRKVSRIFLPFKNSNLLKKT